MWVARILQTGCCVAAAASCGLMNGCTRDKANAKEAVTNSPQQGEEVGQVSDDSATSEIGPVATVEMSLVNNPGCDRPVIAKSPEAVGNPCMTTEEFVHSLTVLTASQKERALQMIAASDTMMAGDYGRLAH